MWSCAVYLTDIEAWRLKDCVFFAPDSMLLALPTSTRTPTSLQPVPSRGRPPTFQTKAVRCDARVFSATALATHWCQRKLGRVRCETRRSAQTGKAPAIESEPPGRLKVAGNRFLDEEGRVVVPKGINFSGLSKVPVVPDGATHVGGPQFYNHREVSFVGRPCRLEDLDSHLQRMRDWGFNLLRLLVTWEALEHAGPGVYDEEYLHFIRRVCSRAGDYGFWVATRLFLR